jgi:hypothetical protein
MLKPLTEGSFSTISALNTTKSWLIARLSGSNKSKKVAACRLGITSVCNPVTGYLSRIAKRERIGRYDIVSRQFAEDTTCLPRINSLADYSEVFVVTGTLVCIASEAKRLKVSQIVLATVLKRDDVTCSRTSSSASSRRCVRTKGAASGVSFPAKPLTEPLKSESASH